MRLQVFLSRSGECSRREALKLIFSGHVKVNNKTIVEPSFDIDPAKDKVILHSKPVSLKDKTYLILNKPKGVVTTKKDRFAYKTVMEVLPGEFRHLYPVGRLDQDTTGLLLLTNDGDLAHRLAHPRFRIDKIYRVVLSRPLDEKHRALLERGIKLEDGITAPCQIKYLGKAVLEIILHEGRKRQIRRMFSFFDYNIIDLKRVAIGCLDIDTLAVGRWKILSRGQVSRLKKMAGLDE